MLQIKLMAEEVRQLRAAKTDTDLRGAVDMVLHKVDEAEAGRVFGPSKRAVREGSFRWPDAFKAMETVLGEGNLTKPPYPEARWFQRVNTVMREYGVDEAWCRKLAEYIKGNLRLPISFQFALEQNARILGGAFDGRQAKNPSGAAGHKVRAPLVESLPKLPED